jgi:hypothetical protein
MGSIILVVEGKYDLQLMATVVPSGSLVIQGVGKFGQRSFIDGYGRSPGATSSQNIIGFRDRDFDFPMSQQPAITDAGNNIWVSHRRTIENYLLTPKSFRSFLATDGKNKLRGISGDHFEALLMDAGKDLRFYQAARQSLGEIRDRNSFETSWTGKSGKLPTNLDRKYCESEAKELLTDYLHNSQKIADQRRFADLYEKYCESFDDDFFEKGKHLEWFQGKDLKSQLSIKLNEIVSGFPWSAFFTYSINNFDYTQFPDLVEFRAILDKNLHNAS